MGCEERLESIGDLVDGTLQGDARRALEQHVSGCPGCAELLADLRSIRGAAASLPPLEPPARAWRRVREQLGVPAQGRVLSWIPRQVWMPIAAAAALVLAFAGYSLFNRPQPPAATLATAVTAPAPSADEAEMALASVEEQLRLAEEHYERAITGLERLARDQQVLDPQVAASLQTNLQVIDQAIDESREALRQQPTSEQAQQSLFDAFRTKVALLQDTIALVNEMRKGNQVEAARIAEGLNKS